jgi:hypothetical protein
MATADEIAARLDDLIARARTFGHDAPIYHALLAQSCTAVAAIAGTDSDYYRLLNEDLVAKPQRYVGGYGRGASIMAECLTNLRSDVASGYLRRQAELVAAEVFGDFLGMAEHLLDHDYYHPAASLIGAVLEDGLRRIARLAEIDVKSTDDITSLNNRLADKGVYSNLVRKQVGVWGEIRNHADHAEWDKYSPPDVRDMYTGVTRFMSERLG